MFDVTDLTNAFIDCEVVRPFRVVWAWICTLIEIGG